ncbi:MAG: hypothetical protein IJS50_00780 [Desulfovibrio sp.]|nr:hypothetical protein [Desulfovibrio sp.]
MKKIAPFCLLLLVCSALPALAGSDKIEPTKYICAEYLATVSVEHAPPLFEGLQIDGYVAAEENLTVADSRIMGPLMFEVLSLCQSQPEIYVYPLWKQVRRRLPVAKDGRWRADKTTCKDYNDDPDDGSGFVIWLDGYIRGKAKNDASVLKSDLDLNAFFERCKNEPKKLMQDVMRRSAH